MLVLLALLPLALAAPPSAHIIRGDEVNSPDRHPWQGSLQFNGGHTCGCVLLTADYVLTAAHCTDGRDGNPDRFGMRFNTVTWRSGGDLYEVATITGHPEYNQGIGFAANDVCVLEPVGSIEGTGVDIDSNEIDTDCWISGWGVTTTGGDDVSEQLMEADMDIMSPGLCEDEYGVSHREDIHICVVDEDNLQGSCNGDSGGPLVCNHGSAPELRGVTSWGINGCYTTFPSVYARLYNSGSEGTNLKEWICDNAPGAGGC